MSGTGLPPFLSYSSFYCNVPCRQKMSTRISFDILEHCDPKGIKDSSKNAWTNIRNLGAGSDNGDGHAAGGPHFPRQVSSASP